MSNKVKCHGRLEKTYRSSFLQSEILPKQESKLQCKSHGCFGRTKTRSRDVNKNIFAALSEAFNAMPVESCCFWHYTLTSQAVGSRAALWKCTLRRKMLNKRNKRKTSSRHEVIFVDDRRHGSGSVITKGACTGTIEWSQEALVFRLRTNKHGDRWSFQFFFFSAFTMQRSSPVFRKFAFWDIG